MRDLSTCTSTLLNIHNTHKHTTKPASNTHALTTTSHVMEPLKTPLNELKYFYHNKKPKQVAITTHQNKCIQTHKHTKQFRK